MDQENKEKLLHASLNKGSNQVSVRSYNERLVLQLVREHGELSKAEATVATGLSPNAISVIFRALESENLLLRGEPIRGRVGQPSVPLRINPDAHFYVTLKIGRRSLELAVVNFIGEVLAQANKFQPFPTPASTIEFLTENLSPVLKAARKSRKAISGMAVAMPFELWSWTEEFGAPTAEMEAWREFDAATEFRKVVPWDIIVENDATAACRAEVVFGSHVEKQDWVYFYIGTFIGGGVVLNGSVFPGRRGNAGGFGPMRVPEQEGGNRLVDHASLVVLERSIASKGGEPFRLYQDEAAWYEFAIEVDAWIERASRNLAHSIVSSLSVMDFEAVVIEGAIPGRIKTQLVEAVVKQLKQTDLQGVLMPSVEAGQVGKQARTVGAAAALVSKDFLVDQNTLNRA